MIAKRVSRQSGQDSFKRLGFYIMSDREKKQAGLVSAGAGVLAAVGGYQRTADYLLDLRGAGSRVGEVRITNCEAAEIADAIAEIQAVQGLNVRAKGDKTYHLVVSFPPGESPTADQLRDIEDGYGDPRWMTYRQAAELGGQVRRGEKSTYVQYWKWREEQPVIGPDGRPVFADGVPVVAVVELTRPRVFGASVFNGAQIEGLEPPLPRPVLPEWQRHEAAETIISGSAADRPRVNVGRVKAEAAAASVGGVAVLPSFNSDDEGSDWNDLAQAVGAQFKAVLREAFAVADRQLAVITSREAPGVTVEQAQATRSAMAR